MGIDMTQTPTQAQPPAAIENAPEELRRMVAPGQEDILAEFLQEQGIENKPDGQEAGEQQSQELLLGKFKSVEDLARSYQELERKLGQPRQEQESPSAPPQEYTPEYGREHYGAVAEILETAEVNPIEMAAAIEQGEDVSSYVEAIVEKGGIPRQVVETYINGLRPATAPQQEAQGFTEQQTQELLQIAGGPTEFQRMAEWARSAMSQQDVSDINEALGSGSAPAARLAMRSLAAAYGNRNVEPPLVGGGGAPKGDTFADIREATAARHATDPQGRIRYDVDSQYRQWFEQKLLRSDI